MTTVGSAGDVPPAVVLGKGKNALAVVRSLGRRGVPVTLANADPADPARVSRFCTAVTSPDPVKSPELFVDFLCGLRTEWRVAPVLIPTGDVEVRLVSRSRARLGHGYRFRMADVETIEALLHKDAFARLAEAHGLPVPATYAVSDAESLEAAARRLSFPCVLKPAFSPAWRPGQFQARLAAREGGRIKRVLVRSPAELANAYAEVAATDPGAVVQEYIEGGDDCLCDFYSYLDAAGEPVGMFMIRKLRTLPVDGNGPGSCVESVWEPRLAEISLPFLKAIRYRGNSAVCFKRAARDGRFYVIEVNARLGLHHALATRGGVNLAYLAYLDAIDASLPEARRRPEPLKWIAIWDDAKAFRRYRAIGRLRLSDWLASFRGEKEEAFLAGDDPRPFVLETSRLVATWPGLPGTRAVTRYTRRALGVALYWSGGLTLLKRASRSATGPVILRYHSIGGNTGLRPPLVVSARHFASHVRYLSRRYAVVPLEAVVHLLNQGRSLPLDCVAITFDDGYRDNYETALPILRRFGCPATLFVIVGCLDEGHWPWPQRLYDAFQRARVTGAVVAWPGDKPGQAQERRLPLGREEDREAAYKAVRDAAGALDASEREAFLAQVVAALGGGGGADLAGRDGMMRWEHLQELERGGVAIGSHTMTHPRLNALSREDRRRELVQARKALESALGREVRLFAYPFGARTDFDAETREAVIAAGYRGACTAVDGANGPDADLFALRRIRPRDEPAWSLAIRLLAARRRSRWLARLVAED